jgi:hypothetical protein
LGRPRTVGLSDPAADRFDRILGKLDREERAWLVERLEPRQCRIARRDALVRDAMMAHFLGPPTVAAKALARALSGYRASNWPSECDLVVLPDSASPRHCALHAILRSNGGEALAWRRIVDICAVAEKPPQLQSIAGMNRRSC